MKFLIVGKQRLVLGLGIVDALLDPVEILAPALDLGVDIEARCGVGLVDECGLVDMWRLYGLARRGWGGRAGGWAAGAGSRRLAEAAGPGPWLPRS